MKLPDFDAWAIFATVAEHGSITVAAKELRVSKATISKAVARLEMQFNTPLFHRTSRQIALTDTGAALLERAQHMLSEAQGIEELAREEAIEPQGLVRIAAPMSFGLSRVAPAIAEFLTIHPNINVDLQLSDERIDIIRDRFDFAIRIAALPDSALRARKLSNVPRCLVAAPQYLEVNGTPRHPAELAEHQMICYSLLSTPETWHFTGPSGEQAAVTTSGRFRVNNGDAMLPALCAGHGIALLPHFIVENDLVSGKIVQLLDRWRPIPIALHLVMPPSRHRPKRVTLALEFLSQRLLSTQRNQLNITSNGR